MRCFHPITAFQPLEGGELTFRELKDHRQLQISCGRCIGCKLRRSGHWATRCMHEARLHRFNSWVTLTYDDDHLPSRYFTGITHPRTGTPIYSGTLTKEHPQKFFRALRKALGRRDSLTTQLLSDGPTNRQRKQEASTQRSSSGCAASSLYGGSPHTPGLRYYYGGEYGEKYGRPHYHACLFNLDFNDKKLITETDAGYKLYESPTLQRYWPHGQHRIGELTWQSAAYTARYITNKITGDKAKTHYEKIDKETGEIIRAMPEFNDMSRRPGIARAWIDQYLSDVYPKDNLHIQGREHRPPRYYDKVLDELQPELLEEIKFKRFAEAQRRWEDNTDERLAVQEQVTLRRIQSIRQKF